MPSFKINLRTSDIKESGEIPIYIIATDGRPFYINLKISCKKHEWDFDQNRPKNLILDKFCQDKLYLIRDEYMKNGFNVKQFKEVIRPEDIRKSFLIFANEIIKQERKTSVGNSQAYQTAISSFNKFMNTKDLFFTDINKKNINDYKIWLTNKGVSYNSQNLYLRTLRAIYRKHSDQHPFKGLIPKYQKTEKKALRENDILKILNYESTNLKTQRSVDLFKLMFYMCGINFLDLFYAEKNQIQGNYFVFKRKKLGGRGDSTKIWLSKKANELLKIYEGETKLLNISDNIKTKASYKTYLKRLNADLNKISNELNIDKITTNVARHSFATIARNKGVPLDVIKLLLSHSDNTITGIYLGDYPEDILIKNIKQATLL